jgi:hypothetical protein
VSADPPLLFALPGRCLPVQDCIVDLELTLRTAHVDPADLTYDVELDPRVTVFVPLPFAAQLPDAVVGLTVISTTPPAPLPQQQEERPRSEGTPP